MSAYRWLAALGLVFSPCAAALPLSAAALQPGGDWLAASMALETADSQRAFPGVGLQADVSDAWRAGIRVPLEGSAQETRWSEARRHGELLALRYFDIAPRLRGTAAAGAWINSGDLERNAHFFTGSVLSLHTRYAATPWQGTLGIALQQFEPHRDGTWPGDIWSLRLAAGRYLPSHNGYWFAGGSLEAEYYRPNQDAGGLETDDGHLRLLGADLEVRHLRWRFAAALQVAVDDSLPPGQPGAEHRLQLQVGYGFGAPR